MLNSRNEGLENVSYEKWKYPVDPTDVMMSFVETKLGAPSFFFFAAVRAAV